MDRMKEWSVDQSVIDAFKATKLSSPSYPFGTATRPRLSDAEDTPGAGAYSIKTTVLGKVPDSKIRSAPQFSLRSRQAFGGVLATKADSDQLPGPGWYTPQMTNPNERHSAKHSFPKGQARSNKKMEHGPGPGTYSAQSSVGRQVLSTKRNRPGIGFGTGERPPLLCLRCDIGPGEYGGGIAACEKQVDSRKKTSGFVKFSQSARSSEASLLAQDHANMLPGPGTYRLPSGLCGGGASYPFRAAPKPSLSGREKFGSPFNTS